MNHEHNDINNLIRAEADNILYDQGLLSILKSFGTPHITGSYVLNLMTWRDLDIYLESEDISGDDFFRLGSELNNKLKPVKMSYRNERIAKTNALPVGLYWGIYLGDERKGAWKIDLWAVDSEECRQRLKFCDDIAAKLNASSREIIMAIKSKCWQDTEYRRSYSSNDIYEAVFDHKVRNIDDFREFMRVQLKQGP